MQVGLFRLRPVSRSSEPLYRNNEKGRNNPSSMNLTKTAHISSFEHLSILAEDQPLHHTLNSRLAVLFCSAISYLNMDIFKLSSNRSLFNMDLQIYNGTLFDTKMLKHNGSLAFLKTGGGMTSSQLIHVLILFWIAYMGLRCLYNIFFHPLRKIPGPWMAAMTPLPDFWHDAVRKGNYIWEIQKMHKRYGTWIYKSETVYGTLHTNGIGQALSYASTQMKSTSMTLHTIITSMLVELTRSTKMRPPLQDSVSPLL
jgi:hypothetical protein